MASLRNNPDDSRTTELHRALPGWAVDKIRFGVTGDHHQVWGALISIAMSAHLRGWTENQYILEVSDPKNRIWWQLTAKSSRGSAMKSIRKAWNTAVAQADENPSRSLEEIRADAADLAFRWTNRLVENPDELSPNQLSVMEYVVSETERRGYLKVTCPAREVAEFAKVPRMTAHRILADLHERGLLIRHDRGRRAGPNGGGKSAIYELSEPAGTYVNGERFPMSQPQALFRCCWFRSTRPAGTASASRIAYRLCAWRAAS